VTTPPGIDVDGVTAWFAQHVPAARPPLSFSLIAGGRSNLTYKVTGAGEGAWVLRRPPLGSVLQSAHDMGREHRVMAALAPTPVPVPPMVGLCEDDSVNGAPFYVMEFVDGIVVRADAVDSVPEPVRWAAAESLVDVLADLHDVDPDAVGLGDLGRKENYVARLLKRWRGQWEKSKTRDLPLVEEVAERLARSIPEQGPGRIVHGDYRLDNAIVSPEDGRLRAVLDWELCTLGDPLADVGLLMVYWVEPGDEFAPIPWAPTRAPGFPGRKEVAARYAERSGRDLSELDFYVALGLWKSAVVLEGVYARNVAGAYGQGDESYRLFETIIPRLAEAAAEAASRAGR
jgi:aminoglycoside phosphotransferase (APT) family kinase protein